MPEMFCPKCETLIKNYKKKDEKVIGYCRICTLEINNIDESLYIRKYNINKKL